MSSRDSSPLGWKGSCNSVIEQVKKEGNKVQEEEVGQEEFEKRYFDIEKELEQLLKCDEKQSDSSGQRSRSPIQRHYSRLQDKDEKGPELTRPPNKLNLKRYDSLEEMNDMLSKLLNESISDGEQAEADTDLHVENNLSLSSNNDKMLWENVDVNSVEMTLSKVTDQKKTLLMEEVKHRVQSKDLLQQLDSLHLSSDVLTGEIVKRLQVVKEKLMDIRCRAECAHAIWSALAVKDSGDKPQEKNLVLDTVRSLAEGLQKSLAGISHKLMVQQI